MAGAASSAYAQDDEPPRELVGLHTERWAVPEGVQAGLIDWDHAIAYCVVGDRDSSCGITQTTTVGYTVSGDFGLSTEYVSASLGISRSEDVSVAVNCRVDRTDPGTRYVAYPTLTRHYFHVMEETSRYVKQRHPGSFGAFNAFDGPDRVVQFPSTFVDIPDGGVACRVQPLR